MPSTTTICYSFPLYTFFIMGLKVRHFGHSKMMVEVFLKEKIRNYVDEMKLLV